MSVKGYLSDFSVPEIFQLLQDGKKTGLLSIQGLVYPEQTPQAPQQYYFIWLHRGRIVTVTQHLDSRDLAQLIVKRRYLSNTMAERLSRRCPPDEPLGRFLRTQGILTNKQLEILFATQVMGQVCNLFKLPDGYFAFDPTAAVPKAEMTGLSVMATEVILPGLRVLKNWEAFQEKLPHPQSSLTSLVPGQPHIRINQVEWSVWRLIDASIPLSQMATQLNLSIEQVQRIAFRLIFVGLAEEIPQMLSNPSSRSRSSTAPTEPDQEPDLSPSFFRNLIGLLRQVPKSS
ncbi:MAG: DUF4388 domain-containing protein [Cyanobacteria bacterium J06642_11]